MRIHIVALAIAGAISLLAALMQWLLKPVPNWNRHFEIAQEVWEAEHRHLSIGISTAEAADGLARLAGQQLPPRAPTSPLKHRCAYCGRAISRQAEACPGCGAPQ